MGNQTDVLLSMAQVLRAVPISRQTLWRLRRGHEFPLPTMVIGRRAYWSARQLEEWINHAHGYDARVVLALRAKARELMQELNTLSARELRALADTLDAE